MIVSGVKDYRVEYKNYQEWLIPKRVVLALFLVGIVFLIIGIIFLAIGGSALGSVGAVSLGLGLTLLVICLLLCLHAYCIRYLRDQSTQTKDVETSVKETVVSTPSIVTAKPPQGVLKSGGRSPMTEPKRVRLQAERDTGFSSGLTQPLSSHLLTEKSPLRSADMKEESQKTSETQASSSTMVTTENHYETLPLKTDSDSFVPRRPGEVFSRSQEAEMSKQVSSTQVVYPQQTTTHHVTRFEAPPPPTYLPMSTNIGTAQQYSTTTYRSDSPSFRGEYNQSFLSSPHPLATDNFRKTSDQRYEFSTQSQSGSNVQQLNFGQQSQSGGAIQHYQASPGTPPIRVQQYYRTMPQQAASQYRHATSEYHWMDSSDHYGPSRLTKSTGQDMTFEDHRSSKMSLYDNLNGFSDGAATM